MAESIEKLRIYGQATELEDRVYGLTRKLPQEQYYPTGNELRRASAAVAHHIFQAHERYSITVKLTELDHARRAAEQTQQLLQGLGQLSDCKALVEGYTGILKQSWGLTKYLRARLAERRVTAQVRSADEMVASRASA